MSLKHLDTYLSNVTAKNFGKRLKEENLDCK